MATTFSDRLTRLETGTVKLYAGDETPQAYKAKHLVAMKPKTKHLYFTALFMGAIMGAIAGYMFQTYVGLEMIFAQSVPMLYLTLKASPIMAASALGVATGPVACLSFLIFSRTHTRILQFWCAYLAGMIAINLQVIWVFYLTMQAAG